MRTFKPFTLVLAAGLCAGPALGDGFTFSYAGALINGSGSLLGTDNGDGTFDITSGELYVTEGVFGGVYSLYQNPNGRGTAISPSGFFAYDNQLTPGSADALVDWYGLLFNSAGAEINIFREGPAGAYTFYAHGSGGDVVDTGSFLLEYEEGTRARPGDPEEPPDPPDLPAPGAAALLGLGLAAASRRRRV